jgi:hypothetical protein
MLRAAVAAADERCRQVERNNQVLRDEYLALQTTNNALEEKFKKVCIFLVHGFSNGRTGIRGEYHSCWAIDGVESERGRIA